MSEFDFDSEEIQQQYEYVNSRWDFPEEEDPEDENNPARLFERSRIKALADEREEVQKKTFTKWVNSHLSRVSCRIGDLYADLRDGRMLIKLLEVLSGERLPKPTKGKMRIHCLENVEKALQFLKEQRVHLENMGSHDIVDGNHRLTLGLIWTIILRFQIQDISVETEDSREVKSAKDALLLWCQMKTAGYPNVRVHNFTTSWRDGLAFNALIHKHRPDLIDFDALDPADPYGNMQTAFNVAEQKLGLTQLLDAEDIAVEHPDEKSVITYVVTYYHYFSKMKALAVEGKRIGKVLESAMETDQMIEKYDSLASDLLDWIEQTIAILNNRTFANSLTGVQQQLQAFSSYRTVEKPAKFTEKGNLEVLLFTIQSRMRANNQKVFLPGEGKLISEINKAWERLEKAEHERELALREELIRQEKLEQLARRFDRKAAMRESWLTENQCLVLQDNFGSDLAAVEAATKKHEAIETDMAAYEERVHAVLHVAQELQAENYHDVARVAARRDNVLRLWRYLQELLCGRRARLEANVALQRTLHEMLHLLHSMEELKGRLLSQDFGKHLLGVDDLLQKHALLEADAAVLATRVHNVTAAARKFAENSDGYQACDPQVVSARVAMLEGCLDELLRMAAERRAGLLESRRLWKLVGEISEEEAWIREKERILSSDDFGRDLTSIVRLLSKQRALEDELQHREQRVRQAVADGRGMVEERHFAADKIAERAGNLLSLWSELGRAAALRKLRLEQAASLFQFLADADDADAWTMDHFRLVSSGDIGHDEFSTQALAKKHRDIVEEIGNYASAIRGLQEQADALPDEVARCGGVSDRMSNTKQQYGDLLQLAAQRKQQLDDALALFKLFSEADACELWIDEKQKWLDQLEIPEKLEDLEVVQHRFEGLEPEMSAQDSRIRVVNGVAEHLIRDGHPSETAIHAKRDNLNSRWDVFRKHVAQKKEALLSALSIQNYHLECRETNSWIQDKIKLVASTQDLGNDLAGVMALQRKLFGIERDLAAIGGKLQELRGEAGALASRHPEQAPAILGQLEAVDGVWGDLAGTLQRREESLGEARKLQNFLRDVDSFQGWLSGARMAVASEELPSSLPAAETLLVQHGAIKTDADNHQDDYQKIRGVGDDVTRGETDAQHVLLQQRLQALDGGWKDLHRMWDNRRDVLAQAHGYQTFLRDASQADSFLTNQEYVLSHTEKPASLEGAEAAIRKHEDFLSSMEANRDRINGVIASGKNLVLAGNAHADKIQERVDNITDRHAKNQDTARGLQFLLKDNRDLQKFLQDCQELRLWISEKMVTASDASPCGEARGLHSKWLKHQAFMAELASNQEWLHNVKEAGAVLVQQQPGAASLVQEKLGELQALWCQLESCTQHKAEELFDANRTELLAQSCSALDNWLGDVENQLQSDDYGQDLTSVNILLNKQQLLEKQVEVRAKEAEDLSGQAEALQREGKGGPEVAGQRHALERRVHHVAGPLARRRERLLASKEGFQFNRDLEDEMLWIEERMPLATSSDHGNNLQTTQLLIKKNETLQKETEGHRPRMEEVYQRGKALLARGVVPPSGGDRLEGLKATWTRLGQEVDKRRGRLEAALRAHQFYCDAAQAEAWMDEQELHMITQEKAKDEASATAQLARCDQLERAVGDYGDAVRRLGDGARAMVDAAHPDSEQIRSKQSQVERLYRSLQELVQERHVGAGGLCRLFHLQREVEDLQQWISEKEVLAVSPELGQDYEHVTMLQEKFTELARDTEGIGQERVDAFGKAADELLREGHPDSPTVRQWKASLDASWRKLLEKMATRKRGLAGSARIHKLLHDARELQGRVQEKRAQIPEESGRDLNHVASLQRMHSALEHDLLALGAQVQQLREECSLLLSGDIGDKAPEVRRQEEKVVASWTALQEACKAHRLSLAQASERFHFFSLVRDLMLWMETIIRQIKAQDTPRDVSAVELLMNYHQGIKAEVEARDDNFAACIDLGKSLIARNHDAAQEIKEKLEQLNEKRRTMLDMWDNRWDWLQILIEVCQFARDSNVAEAWLVMQEACLSTTELGDSVDAVEKLLKRHEALEKLASTWEERFSLLERPTSLEIREFRRRDEFGSQDSLHSNHGVALHNGAGQSAMASETDARGDLPPYNGFSNSSPLDSPRLGYRSQTYQNYRPKRRGTLEPAKSHGVAQD
uniref:Spectrin beta chain n=1 Tax=Petromyzon marinus TaxID=7757 RepID=A0AAJ7TJD4_PETMA|nr:spectrin beta chain, non-erythrocytic 1-like isoform X1 [Petromyzon marinus]